MQSPEGLDWFGGDTPIDSNFLNLGIDTGTKTDVVRLSNASSISMPFVMGKQKKNDGGATVYVLHYNTPLTELGLVQTTDTHEPGFCYLLLPTILLQVTIHKATTDISYLVVACDFWYTFTFAASSELVNMTFDGSHLSLGCFHHSLLFKLTCVELIRAATEILFKTVLHDISCSG